MTLKVWRLPLSGIAGAARQPSVDDYKLEAKACTKAGLYMRSIHWNRLARMKRWQDGQTEQRLRRTA